MRERPAVVRLYESTIPSGNAYKVRLALAQLGQAVEVVELDILAQPSETRTPEFLAKNPNGRIPVVEIADGSYLAESNAILCYLVEGTPLWPTDSLARARALSWMFFEQYSHEPFVAVLKFWTYWGGLQHKRPDEVARWRTLGQAALDVMDRHLTREPYFTGAAYGAADIALFAYTQSAGDIGLEPSAAVLAWLARVRGQPRYVAIKPDPLGLAPTPAGT